MSQSVAQSNTEHVLHVLHTIVNYHLMKFKKKLKHHILFVIVSFGGQPIHSVHFFLIAQVEGNEFCLMAYAIVRVCVCSCVFFFSCVCSLCYTPLFTHALSNFTLHTLSVMGWK